MKTGLTKRQKTTCIYFDEASQTVEIQTHNTALKNRLAQYAAAYPNLCRQTDDNEQGGLTFEIDRRRLPSVCPRRIRMSAGRRQASLLRSARLGYFSDRGISFIQPGRSAL